MNEDDLLALAVEGVGFGAYALATRGLLADDADGEGDGLRSTGRIFYVHGPSPWAVRRKRRDEALLLGRRWNL